MLGVLGGVLVALGVLLVVAANWDSLSDLTKLASLVAFVVGGNAWGLYADSRRLDGWIGSVGYLIGICGFAGGVFLLGQIYNVRAHDPFGFLVVALVATATAALVSRVTVGWVAAAAWLAWAVHEFVETAESQGSDLPLLGLFAVSACVGLAGTALGHALRASTQQRALEPTSILATSRAVATPLRAVSLLSLLVLLTGLSFGWREDFGSEVSDQSFTIQVLVACALALASAAAVWWRARSSSDRWLALGIGLVALGAAASALAGSLLLLAIVANLALAAGGLGLLLAGLDERDRGLYSWGVACLVAFIGARYADVAISLPLGGLAFIGAGVVLIGAAALVARLRRTWQETTS